MDRIALTEDQPTATGGWYVVGEWRVTGDAGVAQVWANDDDPAMRNLWAITTAPPYEAAPEPWSLVAPELVAVADQFVPVEQAVEDDGPTAP